VTRRLNGRRWEDGLRDPAAIAELVTAVRGPVNITGRAGMPDAAALERIGVARVTLASAPALVAMSAIRRLASELRATGSFDGLDADIRHPDAQKLFSAADTRKDNPHESST
jgi:2-methylisocitrate lyase-like PEP mutase family enzyme